MSSKKVEIGFVTDEVSRDLGHALKVCQSWGIRLFELREGANRRFPYFDDEEVRLVKEAVANGSTITAVSPGIFKAPIENQTQIQKDLHETLPAALRLSREFGCDRMIVFGFELDAPKSADGRKLVVETMRSAANLAQESGITIAIENEPAFWFDKAQECVDLLAEIDHPSLKLNWDPANMHWGGHLPTKEDFQTVRPHVINLHVKDYTPHDEKMPWRPVGEGVTPWRDILGWVTEARRDGFDLGHFTIETHYIPAEEGSRQSLQNVRAILEELESN